MKSSCIIIDDEPRAHVVLGSYINRLNYLELKYNAYNALEAYEYLRQNSVDIVFLDIHMPEIDGFRLLNMLEHKPTVIVTTAYTEHAVQSFEHDAIDYLYKPIRFERFVRATEKALKWNMLKEGSSIPEYIKVRVDGQDLKLRLNDILYVESMGNYINIVSKNKVVMVLMTTKQFEEKLPSGIFVRVHKSYIVNLDQVVLMPDSKIQLGEKLLPVGKIYKKYIENILKERGQEKGR